MVATLTANRAALEQYIKEKYPTIDDSLFRLLVENALEVSQDKQLLTATLKGMEEITQMAIKAVQAQGFLKELPLEPTARLMETTSNETVTAAVAEIRSCLKEMNIEVTRVETLKDPVYHGAQTFTAVTSDKETITGTVSESPSGKANTVVSAPSVDLAKALVQRLSNSTGLVRHSDNSTSAFFMLEGVLRSRNMGALHEALKTYAFSFKNRMILKDPNHSYTKTAGL